EVGVTVAASLVLLLLGLPYAVDAREARTAWQQGAVTSEVAPEEAKALIKTSRDRAAGEIIERMDIALTQHGELPPPPGVDKFPGPGESLVSPALAELIDDQPAAVVGRSEEHTSELQSREKLVCRPLLEKKNSLPTPRSLTRNTTQ